MYGTDLTVVKRYNASLSTRDSKITVEMADSNVEYITSGWNLTRVNE